MSKYIIQLIVMNMYHDVHVHTYLLLNDYYLGHPLLLEHE